MPITRNAIPPLALPQEIVAVPALGGEVIVRGMSLPQLMQYSAARRRMAEPLPGETEGDVSERLGGCLVPLALALCVLAEDELPVYTEAQWSYWVANHASEAVQLVAVAMRLSGQLGDQEKKA
jgi:hypothetical protein